MEYTAQTRGKILNQERSKQLILFEGLQFGTATPMDGDMIFEYQNKAVIFAEMKLGNATMPEGQERAYTSIVDGLQDGGKKAVLFQCTHDVVDASKPILARDCIVTRVYFNKHWKNVFGRRKTLKQFMESFLEWVS